MKIIKLSFAIMILLFLYHTDVYSQDAEYKSVKIGTQDWMVKNLDVTKFRNGDTIHHARTKKQWWDASWAQTPAWCYYNNDEENGEKYGIIYNWFAVNDSRGLAPEGWHIPSDEEWEILVTEIGGKWNGYKLRSVGAWNEHEDGKCTNETGFSAMPSGKRSIDGKFIDLGNYCSWWSSTECEPANAWMRGMSYYNVNINRLGYSRTDGLSVRCIKNE